MRYLYTRYKCLLGDDFVPNTNGKIEGKYLFLNKYILRYKSIINDSSMYLQYWSCLTLLC